MVDFTEEQLDLAFAALADPTRRAIIDRLARENDVAVSEIARPFAVSLPAVMKHLDVLARARLIERQKSGRTVRCRLKAAPMETAMQWLARYERFWTERLEALAKFVEEDAMSKPQSPSLTIKRKLKAPAEKVFAAWTQPEALKAWFGPSDDYTVLVAETDVRVGGRYRIVMQQAGGGGAPRRRRLQGDRGQPQAGLHLGVGEHAGAGVARHRRHQAGGRRLR